MIRVNVMYPNSEGCEFNYDYYMETHIPLVQNRLGDALKGVQIYKGLAGAGGSPAPYVTSASLILESTDDFGAAFGPHAEEILGDIPNFTNVEPIIQIEDQLAG